MQRLWTIGLQYSEHGRHRWLSMLDGQSDSCFDFGYCITQVRIIVSVCSNPLPPFLWTLLKRSQTLTLYFDRAKGRFYYLSRGWQVVTRLAYRPVEKVYGPLYKKCICLYMAMLIMYLIINLAYKISSRRTPSTTLISALWAIDEGKLEES